MNAPNHIVGGFTFTGIFASILGVNILSDVSYLLLIGIGALLPDIDHTKSIIGKIFYPFAKMINRSYGHRTITHSLIFIVVSTAMISAFQAAFFPSYPAGLLFGLALSSHIIFDMMTVMGVPLFYPFLKNPCVLPANPRMRMRTGNIHHETIAMCLFLVSALFLQPLFANGFWTTYNRAFGTLNHLKSEYNKSKDLLHVTFWIQEGSNTDSLSGLLIRTDGSKMVLLQDDNFVTYPAKGQRLYDIYPVHTGKKFEFIDVSFYEEDDTFINRLTIDNEVTKIEFSANQKFVATSGTEVKKAIEFKADYINSLRVDNVEASKSVFTKNTTISKLINQVAEIKKADARRMQLYKSARKSYDSKVVEIENESNLIRKEILIEKFEQLKVPTEPNLSDDKILRLEQKIKELQHIEEIRYQDYLKENEIIKTKYSGNYEIVVIH